jgi:hypothetical protein
MKLAGGWVARHSRFCAQGGWTHIPLLILEHECPAFEKHEGWGNRFVALHEAAKLGQRPKFHIQLLRAT